MNQIKFSAGTIVYWLSSKGFVKGVIKRVYYENTFDGKKERTELKYFLWHPKNNPEYMGDDVKEDLIFTSYKTMIEFYSKQKI